MSDVLSVLHATSPLANRMRPRSMSEFIGSSLERRTDLASLFSDRYAGPLPSVILSGPPGSGKTSLAKLLVKESKRPLYELSAVSSGVRDVRDVIEAAVHHQSAYGIQSILFIDEIHRFSKSQQDSLLSAIEQGTICLLAATTENPSISINPALLSRTQVLQLEPLTMSELRRIVDDSVKSDRGLGGLVHLEPDARDAIVMAGLGDARSCLGVLEAATLDALTTAMTNPSQEITAKTPVSVDLDHVLRASQSVKRKYDSSGDQHYDSISAFIKSIRGSDPDAAVYWLARMLDGGEDPRFIARRLLILASEDVGLADSNALPMANAAVIAANQLGMPEVRIPLAHVSIYLALAPKSNSAYLAINRALSAVADGADTSVPLHLRNFESLDASIREKVESYKYPHDFKPPIVSQSYMPEELANLRFFEAKDSGSESEYIPILERIRRILGK